MTVRLSVCLLLLVVGSVWIAGCSSDDPDVETGGSDGAGSTTSEAPPEDGSIDVIVSRAAGEVLPNAYVGCGSGTNPSFPAAALEEVPSVEEAGIDGVAEGMAPFLANEEGQFWPQDGWRVLHATDGQVQLVHLGSPEAGGGLSFMTLEGGDGDGEWEWAGSSMPSDCELWTSMPDGLTEVDWELDPEAPAPTATSTTIDVLVSERACTGGQPVGDLLRGPQVVMTETEALVSFAADQRSGGFDCPGNPKTSVTADLGEALGDRALRDGRDLDVDLRDLVEPT